MMETFEKFNETANYGLKSKNGNVFADAQKKLIGLVSQTKRLDLMETIAPYLVTDSRVVDDTIDLTSVRETYQQKYTEIYQYNQQTVNSFGQEEQVRGKVA